MKFNIMKKIGLKQIWGILKQPGAVDKQHGHMSRTKTYKHFKAKRFVLSDVNKPTSLVTDCLVTFISETFQ